MKEIKKVTVPARTEDVVVSTMCDLCHEKIEQGMYEVNEVTIRFTKGDEYPEGGSGEETTVDMCGKCFESKLIPWLASIGVAPQVKEYSY